MGEPQFQLLGAPSTAIRRTIRQLVKETHEAFEQADFPEIIRLMDATFRPTNIP